MTFLYISMGKIIFPDSYLKPFTQYLVLILWRFLKHMWLSLEMLDGFGGLTEVMIYPTCANLL